MVSFGTVQKVKQFKMEYNLAKARISQLTKGMKKMKLDASGEKSVRKHYDNAALRKKDAPKRTRFHDDIFVLKKYHNDIKASMISAFLPHPASHVQRKLLDVCCGQGTDLHKWNANHVREVVGIDVSPLAIEEAEKRYTESGYDLNASFHVADISAEEITPFTKGQRFPMVTCFFAIQYFFKYEEMLMSLLRRVSESLLPGGYFVGTCPDAKGVISVITEDAIALSTPRVLVERMWSGPASAFGSAVAIEIKNTVTWGDNKNRNVEYLVYESVLKKAAAHYGLYPVDWSAVGHNKNLNTLLGPGGQHGLFRRFMPNEKHFEEKWDLFDVSGTYAAFAFIKR